MKLLMHPSIGEFDTFCSKPKPERALMPKFSLGTTGLIEKLCCTTMEKIEERGCFHFYFSEKVYEAPFIDRYKYSHTNI